MATSQRHSRPCLLVLVILGCPGCPDLTFNVGWPSSRGGTCRSAEPRRPGSGRPRRRPRPPMGPVAPAREPTSWSEVLQQMAPEESERGRSLPVAIAVRSWLQRFIIAEGLCPWAEAALTSGALAVVCLLESDEKAVAQRLLQHGQLLQRAKPPGSLGATTLALAPRCHGLQRLKRFHKVCDYLDLNLDETKVQLAPFHPLWRFEGRQLPGEGDVPEGRGEDAANYVNRSPVPAFHFLRVKEVTAAAADHPAATQGGPEAASASVALRNALLLRKRGVQHCKEALKAFVCGVEMLSTRSFFSILFAQYQKRFK
ncbi:unnamed protein product [Durusdinium trenchii]|uniref:Uncharacterized protein n=1 Tax=Durusdinium trenchii TaxID=1381693 RepID=A0ABP0JPU6_9DINO